MMIVSPALPSITRSSAHPPTPCVRVCGCACLHALSTCPCVRACVRACVRVCVCVLARVRACLRALAWLALQEELSLFLHASSWCEERQLLRPGPRVGRTAGGQEEAGERERERDVSWHILSRDHAGMMLRSVLGARAPAAPAQVGVSLRVRLSLRRVPGVFFRSSGLVWPCLWPGRSGRVGPDRFWFDRA